MAKATFSLSSVLLCNQMFCAIFLAESRLLDFAGGVSRDISENNLLRAFVPRQIPAESINLLLGTFHAFFYGDDSSGNLSETFIRKSNDRHILHFVIGA